MVFAGMLPWSFFSTRLDRCLQQPHQQRQSDQQGLFSAVDRADRDRGGRLRRFPHQLSVILVVLMVGIGSCRAGASCCCPLSSCSPSSPASAPRCGSRRSTSSIGISATSSRSSCSSASMCRRSDFSSSIVPEAVALALFAQSDGRRHRRFSLVHSRRAKASSICPALAVSLGVAAFFLWFGIRRFRKIEKSFADLI